MESPLCSDSVEKLVSASSLADLGGRLTIARWSIVDPEPF